MAIREALMTYDIPLDIKNNLALGVLMLDSQYYLCP